MPTKTAKFNVLKPSLTSKGVVITLPPDAIEGLSDTTPSELYYITVNGVLQLSASKPVATIPVLREEEFSQ